MYLTWKRGTMFAASIPYHEFHFVCASFGGMQMQRKSDIGGVLSQLLFFFFFNKASGQRDGFIHAALKQCW